MKEGKWRSVIMPPATFYKTFITLHKKVFLVTETLVKAESVRKQTAVKLQMAREKN